MELAGLQLRPRRTDDWRPGLVMALAAHGLLLLALLFSVNWRTSPPEAVEAEMWSEIPTAAARTAPPQETAPEPRLEPPPVEAPPPPPPPAPAPAPEPPPADIQVRKEPPKPVKTKPPKEEWINEPPKAKTPPKAAKPEPKPEPKPAPKPEPKPEPKPAKPAPAPPPPGPTAAERERARKAAIERMMADLGGPALSSAGPSGGDYAGRIKARIKPNILFPDTLSGNPTAMVEVRCAADGRIVGRRLVSSSGVPAWDDAVLRAIDKTEVLPANERGHVPPVMQIEFKYKDL